LLTHTVHVGGLTDITLMRPNSQATSSGVR